MLAGRTHAFREKSIIRFPGALRQFGLPPECDPDIVRGVARQIGLQEAGVAFLYHRDELNRSGSRHRASSAGLEALV